MLVKFSTLAGGVWIEVLPPTRESNPSDEYHRTDRCFRFDKEGNSEYAYYGDLISGNPAPRWYSHQFKSSDFTFA